MRHRSLPTLIAAAVATIVLVQHFASAAPPLSRAPEITRISLYGLEAGQTSHLTIHGSDLLPSPRLVGIPAAAQTLRPGSIPERLDFDITVPAGTPIGHYPLRVQTTHGVSRPLPIAVDGLPQVTDSAVDAQHPHALPVAISGEVPSGKPVQAFVTGKKGQRIIIDVECRRLGGTISPVLELKNARRTPLAIQWSQAELQGDARIIAQLPADGVYSVDLHDLAFQVSGRNPFRLKIGELKLADGVFPAVLPTGTRREVKLVGPGWESSSPVTADAGGLFPGMIRSVVVPAAEGVAAPAPVITAGEGIEALERGAGDTPQTINCQFEDSAVHGISINGRIAQAGESDRFLLQVRPNQKLQLRIDSRSLHSRLDPQIVIAQADGSVIAQSEERADLAVTVPPGQTSLLVTIRDLHNLGGNAFPYRLEIIPSEQPDFALALRDDRVLLPQDGLIIVRLDVDRRGYNGPISLTAEGASQVEVQPSEVPAESKSVLLQLKPRAGKRNTNLQHLRIVGESKGLAAPIRRVAALQSGPQLMLVSDARYELPIALLPPIGFTVALKEVPRNWYHGVPASIPLTFDASGVPAEVKGVMFTLVSNEPNINRTLNPIRGTFSLVRNLENKPLALWKKVGDKEQLLTAAELPLRVPAEGVDRNFDAVVRADLLAGLNDPRPFATTFTKSFHVSVPPAVTIKHSVNTIILASGGPTKFTGKVIRHPDYKETVEVSLTGLAADYHAPKVSVPPDQDSFEMVITSPKVTAGGEILNINFVLKDTRGNRLQNDVLFSTRIEVKKRGT